MPMTCRISLQSALAALLLMTAPVAPAVERAEVPEQHKWDLASLYPGEPAWVAAKQGLSQPFDPAMREMNRIMDEMERILARQQG
jgi:hypothetical protein